MGRRQRDTPKKGDLVKYDDLTCRVLKRQCVSGLAMFQTGGDFEVFLQSLDHQEIGWVGENEVEKVSDEAGGT